MRKLLTTLLAIGSITVLAQNNYKNFQKFDDQVGFGIIFQQGTLSGSDYHEFNNTFGISSINLEVEKLFDIGLWLDVNTSNVQVYTQSANNELHPLQPLGAYPFMLTFNSKLGYNIPLKPDIALVPYALIGKNANLTTFTGLVGGAQFQGVTKDFFYTFGVGARFEKIITKNLAVFFDQLFAYNQDNSDLHANVDGTGPIMNASNYQFTSMLGAKINLWQDLQLASNVFYMQYNGYDTTTLNTMNSYQGGLPTSTLGIQMSGGFTF